MEEELKELVKTRLLTELNAYYKNSKNFVFFIGNEVLRIVTQHDGKQFQQIYVDPLKRIMFESDFVSKISADYREKCNRWILAQFRGW